MLSGRNGIKCYWERRWDYGRGEKCLLENNWINKIFCYEIENLMKNEEEILNSVMIGEEF